MTNIRSESIGKRLRRRGSVQAETVLTARQQEIWQVLGEYVDGHGYPPTVREIGERVGLASPSTVHAHLANLERAGYLRRDPTKPRALELTGLRRSPGSARRTPRARARRGPRRKDTSSPRTLPTQALPLVGEIAAGGPLL